MVRAVVVLRDGHDPAEALARELQEHVKATTAPYKYPRLVEFASELPKTPSGKIKRAELRSAAAPPPTRQAAHQHRDVSDALAAHQARRDRRAVAARAVDHQRAVGGSSPSRSSSSASGRWSARSMWLSSYSLGWRTSTTSGGSEDASCSARDRAVTRSIRSTSSGASSSGCMPPSR